MSSRAADIARWSVLAAIVALSAFLRFDGLGRPSYWLDEILGQQLTTEAAQQPPWHWVTGLEPEHGPLYYATQLATRLAGNGEMAGRLAGAIFGVIAVLLVWFAGMRLGERSMISGVLPAALSAFLLALSPLHVYYSREARPYALVMLLTAAMVIVLLSVRSVSVAVVVLIALLYTSAVALPVVAAAAVTASVAALLSRETAERKRLLVIAGIAASVAVLFLALYRGSPSSYESAGFPRSPAVVIEETCRALTVSALGTQEHGRTTIVLLVLAALGAVALTRRNRVAAAVTIGMTILPALFAALSLRLLGHWFAARYLAPAVIAFVLLVACGMVFVGEMAAASLRRWRPTVAAAIATVIAVAVGTQTWAAVRREPFEKVDWRAIAAALERHVRSGDVLVFADPWSDVCTRYYLPQAPPGVRIALTSPHMSRMLMSSHPVWIVSDGLVVTQLRSWACRFPMVLGTRLESVQVSYGPSAQGYIRAHSTPEDLRALAASLGSAFAIHVGANDEALLGEGWGTSEGSAGDAFRWAIGLESSFVVPRWGSRDRIVSIHAMPAAAPAQSQRLALVVNGRTVAEVSMAAGWRDYAFDVPAAVWIDGLNTISFRFARTIVPASLEPRSTDRRALAACFDAFAVHDRGTPVPRPSGLPPLLNLSFASADLLAARGAERSEKTRFPAGRLNRAAVESLLGRLGIDPLGAWPLLERDRLHVEDVVDTMAYRSACEDDRAFLDRAFAIMVQRRPNSVEESDLLARLSRGTTRVQILHRITNADDFRAAMLVQ